MERGPGGWLLWLAAGTLLVLAGTRLIGGGPDPAPVRVEAGTARPRAARSAPAAAAALYVHVAGRVRRPGLYRLAHGGRVAEAIARAGGPAPRADLAKVNLAARVEDGQQVVVPRVGAVAASAAGGPAGGAGPGDTAAPGSAAGAKLSLASATVEQLDALDGIGPTLARRIVEFREKRGGYRSVGQLREVEGIGEKRFESLREAVGP